jgi:hypothetical protein
MIETHTCHTIVCDSCKETLNPADEGELHFANAEHARTEAERYYEWTCEGGRDLCPACSCAAYGYVPRKDQLFGGRYCTRCEEAIDEHG